MNHESIVIPLGALRRVGLVVAALLVVGLAATGWQQRDRLGVRIPGTAVGDEIDPQTYQAVFLTGGQAYFGKLLTRGDDLYLLSDVYYLGNPREGGTEPGPLLKRGGSEVHGPKEPMIIPARAVLFIENMREDSEVMLAIRRFKSGESVPAAPTPTRAPTAAPAATPRPSPTP